MPKFKDQSTGRSTNRQKDSFKIFISKEISCVGVEPFNVTVPQWTLLWACIYCTYYMDDLWLEMLWQDGDCWLSQC